MSCCVTLVFFLKRKFEYIGNEVEIFVNKILEIDEKNDKKEYNLISLDDIKKDDDHIIIDMPINKNYDII